MRRLRKTVVRPVAKVPLALAHVLFFMIVLKQLINNAVPGPFKLDDGWPNEASLERNDVLGSEGLQPLGMEGGIAEICSAVVTWSWWRGVWVSRLLPSVRTGAARFCMM